MAFAAAAKEAVLSPTSENTFLGRLAAGKVVDPSTCFKNPIMISEKKSILPTFKPRVARGSFINVNGTLRPVKTRNFQRG